MSTDQPKPTREATQPNDTETETMEGIYLLENRYTRTYIDMGNGTPVYMRIYINNGGFTHQHWETHWTSKALELNPVCSFQSGRTLTTFYTYESGEEGKRLECKSGGEEARQQWGFTLEEGNYFSIRNIQFSDKVLEVPLDGKALDDSHDIVSRKYIRGLRHQQWALQRRSRTVSEIKSLVGGCPILKEREITWPPAGVKGFIVVRYYVREYLLMQSGLMREVSRLALFDDKTFALKMKEAVQSWCAKNIEIEGYGSLFGVVCGSADVGSGAYNWYLTGDLSDIIFLDPLNGREFTAKGLQEKGFRAEWAIC